jgi:methyl-accepting chemotaxis protein
LIADLEATQASGKSYRESKVFQSLPIVAGWSAAGAAAEREGLNFSVRAFEARNPDNEPEPGSFEETLLRDLTTQVNAGDADWVARINHDTNALHYMRSIKLTADCLMCHGEPGNEFDPDGTGIDIVGFPMEGWSVGDMHGAYHIVTPLNTLDQQTASFIGGGLMTSVPIIIGVVVLIVYLCRRMISRPIGAIAERMGSIASGDLTARVEIKSQDELGDLASNINSAIESFRTSITEVAESTEEVAGAAEEIAAASEEMSAGMQQQSSQMMQISSAVEEMAASISQVAGRSTDATAEAESAGEVAAGGGETVQATIDSMNEINAAVQEGAASVEELGKRGEQIGQIIAVINDIADQTNLLALNAAIEAARAGEHGRGFAVVADEVRKLADRTTKATDEIAGSIQMIQTETGRAVDRMNTGTQRVATGVERAEHAGANLQQIVERAQSVASIVSDIAAATEQQASSSSEISSSLDSIRAVTEETVRGAGRAATAASQLKTRSEQLRSLVGRFRV